jgi:hypothetical protein
MSFVSSRQIPGHVAETLMHINQARDATARNHSIVEVARALFDGLNKIQTEWALDKSDQEIGEVKGFQLMVLEGLQSETRSTLLRSGELQSLVSFQPQIMNHDVLRRRGYRPGVEIEPRVIREASEVHRKLAKAYSELDGPDPAIEERILKRTAELLYIVRSNIAHGERRPMDRTPRNGNVTKLCAP